MKLVLWYFEAEGILGVGPQSGIPAAVGVDAFTVCLGSLEFLPEGGARRTPSRVYWDSGDSGRSKWPDMVHMESVAGPLGEEHWSLTLRRVDAKAGPQSVSVCGDAPCVAIVDTASSEIVMPRAHLTRLFPSGLVTQDCSNMDALPTLHLRVGSAEGSGPGLDLQLSPEAYVERTFFMALRGVGLDSWTRPVSLRKTVLRCG